MAVRLTESTVRQVLHELYGLDFSRHGEPYKEFKALFARLHMKVSQIARIDMDQTAGWCLVFYSYQKKHGFRKLISLTQLYDFKPPKIYRPPS